MTAMANTGVMRDRTPGAMRPGQALAVALALGALAFGLRLFRIDAQSLWYDEGLTIALAGRSLDGIARAAAADVHPPLYYWLLHGWLFLFGSSEAAARALSALCGALTVGLLTLLGWRRFGAAAGGLAGLAAALSPFAIHYGQETRMYALAALLTSGLWCALFLGTGFWAPENDRRQTTRRSWVWLSVYWLLALAALLTHYFAAVFVATAAGAGLLCLRRRAWPAWIAAHLALALVYLPQIWSSRERLAGWTAAKQPTDPLFILGDVFRVFSLGPAAPADLWPWLLGFAVLLGVAALALQRSPMAVGVIAGWLVIPLAAIVVLSLNQPYYKPRFLLPALPAFQLLLGLGGATLARHAAARFGPRAANVVVAGCGIWLVAAAVTPLRNEWFDPAFQRDDYRGLSQAIAATARPDDALLLIGPGQIDVFDYYFHGPQPRYLLPRFRPLDPVTTLAELDALERAHRRVYGVFYVPYEADPAGVIGGWLAERAWRAESRWYGGVELVVYELGEADAPARDIAAAFGDALLLERAAVTATLPEAGDAVRVELFWRVTASLNRDLLVFAHLIDERGQIVAQHDGPLGPLPTSAWQPGEARRSRFAVLVPPGAPPGAYRLALGVWDPASGERLPLANGQTTLELAVYR